MNDLRAIYRAIRDGDLEACGPLADLLEECGHALASLWLRGRVRPAVDYRCGCSSCTPLEIAEFVGRLLAELEIP